MRRRKGGLHINLNSLVIFNVCRILYTPAFSFFASIRKTSSGAGTQPTSSGSAAERLSQYFTTDILFVVAFSVTQAINPHQLSHSCFLVRWITLAVYMDTRLLN